MRRIKMTKKLLSHFDRIIEVVNVLLIVSLTLSVILSVLLRYVFNISFIWAEEAIIFMFIGTTYFGIVMCVQEGEHIDINYFKNLFPKTLRKVIETFIHIVSIVTLLYLAYISLGWIEKVGTTLTSGIKIPSKYIYSLMPIAFVLSSINEIRRICRVWRDN
jgi:TRAP-type C4-dicarboxylate transport system permease small subunit